MEQRSKESEGKDRASEPIRYKKRHTSPESRSDQRLTADWPTIPLTNATATILGGRKAIGAAVDTDADMTKAVELGFSVGTLDALKEYGVTDKEISYLIIKPRTLSHRKAGNGRLTVEESDRAARVARIMALAERTFANREKADRWLHKNLVSLDDRRPIDLIQTTAGARLVEDILAKIAWGAAA